MRYYALTFKRLDKYTEPTHPAYQSLVKTNWLIEDLNQMLIDLRTDSEHLLKLQDLARRVSGLDPKVATHGGRLYREGWLEKVNPKGKVQKRWFILTRDHLYWTVKSSVGKSHELTVRGSCPLDCMLLLFFFLSFFILFFFCYFFYIEMND